MRVWVCVFPQEQINGADEFLMLWMQQVITKFGIQCYLMEKHDAKVVSFGQDQVNLPKGEKKKHEWSLEWMRYYHIIKRFYSFIRLRYIYMKFGYGAGAAFHGLRCYYYYHHHFFGAIFTSPYILYFMQCAFNVVGRMVGRSVSVDWDYYASLVFILIVLTDYYWHVRTKYEYLMLLSHWMCIKNWDYHNRPCCWRAKSLTSNLILQIFSTLHSENQNNIHDLRQANKEEKNCRLKIPRILYWIKIV